MASSQNRLPPSDIIAEKAVIGGIIIAGEKSEILTECLKTGLEPDHFYTTPLRETYRSILEMWSEGAAIDLVTLNAELVKRNIFSEAWNLEHLIEIVQNTPNSAHSVEYAKIVRRKAVERHMLRLHGEISEQISRGETPNGELHQLAELAKTLEDSESRHPKPKTLAEIRAEIKAIGEVQPISSSIPGLDTHLAGGYRPRQFVIMGAFTGGGKTTTLIREARHKAIIGHPVLYVSCELAAVEIVKKLDLASEDGTPQDLSIEIEDRFVDFPHLSETITKWAAAHKGELCPFVVIDYIQRVRGTTTTGREREVAQVAEDFQTLAKLQNIVIVAAAQLNRASQQEEKAELHHLRESGLIEQTGDVVLLLSKIDNDKMNVQLAKNRWGPSGMEIDLSVDFVKCYFGLLGEGQLWQPLIDAVVKYVLSLGGRAPIRDVCMDLGWGGKGKHPTKYQLQTASFYTKSFRIEGSEIVLS